MAIGRIGRRRQTTAEHPGRLAAKTNNNYGGKPQPAKQRTSSTVNTNTTGQHPPTTERTKHGRNVS
eukprot:2857590-Lingulodinium_polyedra.AAC.1